MRTLSILFSLASFIFGSLDGFSQTNRKVTGKVTDTSGVAVSDATILLIHQKDTLSTQSDTEGLFNFKQIKTESFTLSVALMGYQTFKQQYVFGKKRNLNINDITLKLTTNMLKEVVIKTEPNPVRVMQDTIEYNVAAYKVFDGDNMADLIRQFPGIEVDDDYNVTTMGKNVVKLRVNGKDFFTNDVKEFVATLPAGIASKIQIIDDYGDEANFTGLKIGEPQKLINIVTKPGLNQGKFGNMAVNAGSNDQIGSKNKINLWHKDKQTGMGLNYTTQNNGAGNSKNTLLSINHRDKVGTNGGMSFNYNLNQNNNAFANQQAVETVSELGTYYNDSESNGESKNGGHRLRANFNNRNKKLYINGDINASYGQNANNNFSLNNQSGVIKQDFKNYRTTEGRSPSVNANFRLSKKLRDNKDHFSANAAFSVSNQTSNQLVNTNTLYYEQQDHTLLKDSVLNRDINNKNSSQGFSFGTNYSVAIGNPKDSVGKKHINLSYSFSLNNSFNHSATHVLSNLTHEYLYVDSLSSEYKSLFINQSLGANYSYSSKKEMFVLGINGRPVLLQNNYLNLGEKITTRNFNFSPTLNYTRELKQGNTLSFRYTGINNSPSPYQLLPVPNTQNLQNIVIGNPNLKPSFQHSLNTNYNYVEAKSGTSMFVAANFSTTQNQIVNNIIVIPDTLGSYKQETRYENTNGTYNLSSNYNISIPIKKKLLKVDYSGVVGLSNRALIINNTRHFNRGLNFSQNVAGHLSLKKMTFNMGAGYNQVNNNHILGLQNSLYGDPSGSATVIYTGGNMILPTFNPGQLTTTQFFTTRTFSTNFNGRLRLANLRLNGSSRYSYSSNSNTSLQNGNRDLQTFSFSLNGNAKVKQTYRIGFSVSKRINTGYAIAHQNPLLLGANLSKHFLKNKALSLTISASDLLNQGNMISRQVSGNSVIDSKNNTITRVFAFGLRYNLSKFGAKGTDFHVEPDY